MKRIKKFIEDNSIDLTGSDSELNSNCVTLAGFSLWVMEDANDFERLEKYLERYCGITLSYDASVELERVFDYAYMNGYRSWWDDEANRALYKF